MSEHNLSQELYKACTAEVSMALMLSQDLEKEIKILQEYLGRKFNNLDITKDLESKIKEIDYSLASGFDKWFSQRIDFYKNKWEEMMKYKGKILSDYDFMSETFKILDRCSWWVQNAYQPFSGAKKLLHKLDCIAARFEKEKENKKVLKEKAEKFCHQKGDQNKKFRGGSSKELSEKERENERQIFSFFAELEAGNEMLSSGFSCVQFLKEGERKMPDLLAKKEGELYYAELKRIQNPREEDEALRSTGVYLENVNQYFRTALQKKIGDFICDAKEKFTEQNNDLSKAQKILVLDFEPGIDARLKVNFNPKLEEIFDQNYFPSLEQTHDITIWLRKYF